MKAQAELSYVARYAVIHFNLLNKTVTVEEAASMRYVLRVLIGHYKESYMKSGYLCVMTPDKKRLIVLDKMMNLIAIVCYVAIHRR